MNLLMVRTRPWISLSWIRHILINTSRLTASHRKLLVLFKSWVSRFSNSVHSFGRQICYGNSKALILHLMLPGNLAPFLYVADKSSNYCWIISIDVLFGTLQLPQSSVTSELVGNTKIFLIRSLSSVMPPLTSLVCSRYLGVRKNSLAQTNGVFKCEIRNLWMKYCLQILLTDTLWFVKLWLAP